jgi:hypothetical protein
MMPYGFSNAHATFMCLKNDVLHPLLDSFFMVYLYDILIFSSTWEEPIEHIK